MMLLRSKWAATRPELANVPDAGKDP